MTTGVSSPCARAFEVNRDRNFLWLGERHRDALEALYGGVLGGDSLVVLTGDVGAGKTMLIDAVAARLSAARTIAGWLTYPSRDPDDFWNAIAGAFGLHTGSAGPDALRTRFLELVRQAARISTRVLLVVDEAQVLTREVLIEVMRVCDAATAVGGPSALAVVLVGEDELNVTLARPELTALARRIGVSRRLSALDEREVAAYVRHRLACADASPDLFTPDALAAIATISRGIPRLINTVCAQASARGGVVDATMVERCGHEMAWLNGHGRRRARAHAGSLAVARDRRSGRRSLVVAMLAATGVLAFASPIGDEAHVPSRTDAPSPAAPPRPALLPAPATPTPDVAGGAKADPQRPPTRVRKMPARSPGESPPAAAAPSDDAPGDPDPSAIIDWLLKDGSRPTAISR
jgi:general secretion pathway protein A